MRLFLVFMLVAALCTAGTPATGDSDAWREACSLSGYSCTLIHRPLVARAPMWPLYGRYRMGDAYILVDEKIDGNLAYAVRVHEMVHYLQWMHGKWTFTTANRCLMEQDAFAVSNRVLRRLKEYNLQVRWDTVKSFYGCDA